MSSGTRTNELVCTFCFAFGYSRTIVTQWLTLRTFYVYTMLCVSFFTFRGLNVNAAKQKSVVCNKRDQLRQDELWNYNGQLLEWPTVIMVNC